MKGDDKVTLIYQIDEPYYLVGAGVIGNGQKPLSKRGDEVEVKKSKVDYILKCLKRGDQPLFKLKEDKKNIKVNDEAIKPLDNNDS